MSLKKMKLADFLPLAATFIPGVGPAVAGAFGGGLGGQILGQAALGALSNPKNPLLGAAGGAVGGAAGQYLPSHQQWAGAALRGALTDPKNPLGAAVMGALAEGLQTGQNDFASQIGRAVGVRDKKLQPVIGAALALGLGTGLGRNMARLPGSGLMDAYMRNLDKESQRVESEYLSHMAQIEGRPPTPLAPLVQADLAKKRASALSEFRASPVYQSMAPEVRAAEEARIEREFAAIEQDALTRARIEDENRQNQYLQQQWQGKLQLDEMRRAQLLPLLQQKGQLAQQRQLSAATGAGALLGILGDVIAQYANRGQATSPAAKGTTSPDGSGRARSIIDWDLRVGLAPQQKALGYLKPGMTPADAFSYGEDVLERLFGIKRRGYSPRIGLKTQLNTGLYR